MFCPNHSLNDVLQDHDDITYCEVSKLHKSHTPSVFIYKSVKWMPHKIRNYGITFYIRDFYGRLALYSRSHGEKILIP